MASWPHLIMKIQELYSAFEEDLASSCFQLSRQLCVSVQQVTQQSNCHSVVSYESDKPRHKQLKSFSGWRVPVCQDMMFSIQEMPLPLKPLKSNLGYHLQKRYKYVNKKFIVCKETKRDEKETKSLSMEPCQQLILNDPFEFVETQCMPLSNVVNSGQQRHCAAMFEEASVCVLPHMSSCGYQPVTDNKHTEINWNCRRQHSIQNDDKALGLVAVDISDAETFVSIEKSQNVESEMFSSARVAGISSTTCNITRKETFPAAGVESNEIYDNVAVAHEAAAVQTDNDVCNPDRQSYDNGFEKKALKDEKSNDITLTHPDISVKLFAQQLHSGEVLDTDNTEKFGTHLRSADSSDTAFQLHVPQHNLHTPDAVKVCDDAVNTGTDCQSYVVFGSPSDVTLPHCITDRRFSGIDDPQHTSSPGTGVTVANQQNSVHCMSSRDHTLTDTVNGQNSLSCMFSDSCDRISVKSSPRKIQRKKKHGSLFRADDSSSRQWKDKSADVNVSHLHDDSSG